MHGLEVRQIAWVVDDLDAAVEKWRATTDIGPFYIGRHVGATLAGSTYRGGSAEVDISVAVAQAGAVQIELVCQHDDKPSPFRQVYAAGEGGHHHIQGFVDDVDAESRKYEQQGFEVVMSGLIYGVTPVAYIDTRPFLGCMTELLSREGPIVASFEALKAAAENWDGNDPVRDFATLMS